MPDAAPRLTLLGRWITAFQPLWRAGMENDPLPDPPIEHTPGSLALFRATSLDVLAVYPTHIGRPVEEARKILHVFAGQLADAAESLDLPIGLVLGVQFQHPADLDQAHAFAEALLDGLPVGLNATVALLIRSRIKTDTINAAFELATSTGARWQTWIDDDITLAEGGLTALLAAARDHEQEEIWTFGLTRTSIRGADMLSGMTTLRRRHNRGQPYPIGCSVLVRTDAPVWPIPRWSDDSWLAARIIDPVAPRPFRRSLIVETHDVKQQVPEGLGYAWSRVRRIHTNQIMILSILDPLQGQRYMMSGMFGGIFGRGGGVKAIPGILVSLAMQSVAISMWLMRAHFIALRGALHMPVKRPPWAVGDKYVRPAS